MGMRDHRFSVMDIASILVAAAIVLIYGTAAQAQSGRRSTNAPTTTPSVSGPKAVEKKPAAAPRLMLLVGIEDSNTFSNIPYYLSDTVLENCVRRLGDAVDVNATTAGRSMARADAIRRAKSEKDAYVIWLQIESDTFNSAKQSKNGPAELYVAYTIFEPLTAKVKQSGRTHQQIYKTGHGGISVPTASKNSPLYSEYAVKQAAREAAERALEAFDITPRDERWPK